MVGVLAAVALVLYALFHALFAPASRVRSLPKPVWIIAIILLPVIGAGLWFWLGAPRRERRSTPLRPVQRGLGPDDDPEFLRRLETQRRQKEREARLSEREDELKRREGGSSGSAASHNEAPGQAPSSSSNGPSDQLPGTPPVGKRGADDQEDPSTGTPGDPRPGPTTPAKD